MAEQQQLIVDFPTHRNNNRSVHFSDTSELYTVPRHDDNEEVCRQEDLWCNKADYSRMRRAVKKSVRKIREEVSAGVPISYFYDGSLDAEDDDDCLIGIEHLLTPDIILKVKIGRLRCTRAVLQEQARQIIMNPSSEIMFFGWDSIAMASLGETRRAAVRARKLGQLHHEAAVIEGEA